ncbi:MAG: hypothetical protein GY858_01520 [Candidatus Omnitrophica bacterium]|nr:hypothetical protein [Candidatus Omnitrophota bacterium]
MVELKDIKGPINFGLNYAWLIALIILAVIGVVVFFIIKKHRKKEKPLDIKPKIPAYVLALEALDRLKNKNLSVVPYYVELSLIVRTYLEDRFDIRAPEMTTEEFLFYLVSFDSIGVENKNMLKDFLNHCDMVKFAKYDPQTEEMEKSLSCAYKLIGDTSERLKT